MIKINNTHPFEIEFISISAEHVYSSEHFKTTIIVG